ncbi:hypothetical protein NE237_018267 [Protea cynaroides]|uniref:NAB domain-containing protein n=1 Tax=Protea cynaroides TaxID=273540 RepID=A0A9Q0QNU9_9MAGN|nr:hypothetical protein NE237_018267 [Protea cynaroides]
MNILFRDANTTIIVLFHFHLPQNTHFLCLFFSISNYFPDPKMQTRVNGWEGFDLERKEGMEGLQTGGSFFCFPQYFNPALALLFCHPDPKSQNSFIEEDADSFARMAEMYYRKRLELMKLIGEFYRAYRALAERYDHEKNTS